MTLASPKGKISQMESNLKYRIFNALPSGTYSMGRLIDLVDIVESDHVASASIECSHRPKMFINPEFVKEYCKTDEHLFLLVMHELYHVILGHTRLFDRPTKAHNIVFDAVINSLLCHEFPGEEYASFFKELNPWNSFPNFLLRPPPKWPDMYTRYVSGLTRAQQNAVKLLYGKSHEMATYHDVWEALLENPDFLKELAEGKNSNTVLLGSHCDEADSPSGNGVFREIIREMIESWPPPKVTIAGRDLGRDLSDFFLNASESPEGQFMVILKKLLKKAGFYVSGNQGPRRLKWVESSNVNLTPIPQIRDRRVFAHKLIHGSPPLFYLGVSNTRRRQYTPTEVAHVYLDISGSMKQEAEIFCAALKPFHRNGEVKIHVFSTVIDTVDPRRPLDKQNLKNTFGTDIQCVVDHLLSLPKKSTPTRVLLLTDGYTGTPSAGSWKEIQSRKIEFHAGLVGRVTDETILPYLTHYANLPSLRNYR